MYVRNEVRARIVTNSSTLIIAWPSLGVCVWGFVDRTFSYRWWIVECKELILYAIDWPGKSSAVASEKGPSKMAQNGARKIRSAVTPTKDMSEPYESIMGLVESTSDPQKRMDQATEALSGRLNRFRKWFVKEAGGIVHSAVCIVNGEATDGTRNAPLLTTGLPTEEEKSGDESSGETRLGRVDGEGEQALYEKNIGCQIRTTREIKENDTMLVIPRAAMVTPDLVASSDAGRAVLACCKAIKSNGEMGFWDAFTDTAEHEAKFSSKSTGPQSLMKILQERKKVEAVVAQRETDPSIELAEFGSVSRRAPLLAFLIHQRFSNQQIPLVSAPYSDSLDKSKLDNDGNALGKAKPISIAPGVPDSFAPYARTLPSVVPMPLCWKRNELALLTGCIPGLVILQEVAAQTAQLASEFSTLVRAGLLERFPDVFPPGVLTWDRWVWAASIFTSRVLPVGCYLDAGDSSADSFKPVNPMEFQSPPEVWEELGVMIPFLDMLNHEIDAHQVIFKPSVPKKDDGFGDKEGSHHPKVVFHKKVKKGSEVFTAYGKLGNHSMILRYGMAQMNNFYEEVKIGLGLSEAVGDIPAPSDYIPVVEKALCVFETSDSDATDKWWTDERLALLHREAGIDQAMLSNLKQGRKLQAVAYNDGAYHPTLISACLVATAPSDSIAGHLKSSTMSITKDHLNSTRNHMASIFRQKLEKLLSNIETGLKAHYSDLVLWKKASEGGLKYSPPEGNDSSCIGWQTFFDKHAYHSSMEVEKNYYAMGPDSCTLTLYDGQLRTLHNSLDGIVNSEKFEAGVKQQLDELGYTIVEDGNYVDESGEKGSESNKPGTPDKKGSPGRKKRNKKKNSGGGNNGAAGGSSGGADKPPALKLHVGNLSYATTPSDLYDYFSSLYGKEHVLECHIPIERASRRSRGFGFVTMPESIAEKVLGSNQKHEIDGRLLKVAKSNSAGTSDSARAVPGPPSVSSDRCAKCGYRPKYCECSTPKLGGGPGPLPPPDPQRGRDSPGYPDYGRPPSPDRMRDDYYRYERERDRDRYRDDYYRRRDYERDYYERDYERDYYDRDYDMDRDRYRHREESPRYMDYEREERRSRSERSRERRRDRSRDLSRERSRDSRSPSRRREEERRRDRDRDRERDRERRPEDEDWDRDRDRKRSRSRSRERSRKKKSKKRES